ncbi:MAG: hypothetical protein NVSMB62_24660 [Acidobacteriaceae bacterium]
MISVSHPLLDTFLLGFIAACSLCAGLFFLRFWGETRDPLFLAFGGFFAIQGGLDALILGLSRPNEGSRWFFGMRLFAIVLVLGAILWKNRSSGGARD